MQRLDVSDHPDDIDWARVARYLDNEATAEEAANVAVALRGDPALAASVAALRAARLRAADPATAWNRTRALHAVLERTREQLDERVPPRRRTPVGRRMPGAAMLAAGVVGVAMLVFGGVLVMRGHDVGPSVSREYVTARAQHQSIQLADGSQVRLAPSSWLRYTVRATGARVVELRGQAYFTVAADPARTFEVRTGAVVTRVLGTAFDVRHYPDDADVQVAVTHGKVSSGGVGVPVVLTPGMIGRVRDSTATAVVARPDAIADWTRGALVFRNAPLSDVLATGGRWWGYEFRVADSTIARRRVTMTLSATNAAEALRMLRELLDVRMTFDGDTVTVTRDTAVRRQAAPPRRAIPETYPSLEVGK